MDKKENLAMTKSHTAIEKMSYEAAFSQLEEVVRNLETGELSLEEAIRNFEQGQMLSNHCSALLDGADLKIRELSGPEMDTALT